MNKYFVYEGSILMAAQTTFVGAMRYFKSGRIMLNGNDEIHVTDLTVICNRLKFIEL